MIKTTLFEKFVLLTASVVSVIAVYVSFTTGLMLAYNDATAHLNTARRVFDNLTPGLVQLGSVWLPLLHVLELPFVLHFRLWQTGFAGAIVSSVSFVVGAYFLYKLCFYVTRQRLASFVAVVVLCANVNFLYLQTTAMFEPLLIALASGATYFLTKWAKEFAIKDLVLAALFTMLATLTRYDGWALFLAASGFVYLYTLLAKKKIADGMFILFVFLAGFGILLWLIYNGLIFSDPLFFARSEFSAKAQQDILFSHGALPAKHNVPLSVTTYTLAMLLNNGLLLCIAFLVGLVAYLRHLPHRSYLLAPLLLLVPYGFNIASLYLGQSVIWLPSLPPYFATYFNARYGLLMIPAVAFFVGFLASRRQIIKFFLLYLIAFQALLLIKPAFLPLFASEGIITLKDTVSSVNEETRVASTFLHNYYNGGLILVSSASADAFIFRTGLPLKNFITEGTGRYWRESLVNPTRYATWLVFFGNHSDRVGGAMVKYTQLETFYERVYSDNIYEIWKKKSLS